MPVEMLRLTEGAPPRRLQLSAQVAQALSVSEVATVSPTFASGEWEVAVGRRVGAARVGGLQVIVAPKVSIQRLVFLMGYARDPGFWREPTVGLDVEQDLPDALGEAFGRIATTALEQGLLHGYVGTEDSVAVLRGRIRVGEQIRRRFGRAIPLEVRYDEFTADIAENQLLLAATLRLLRLPTRPTVRRRLQRLRLQLSDVTTPTRGTPFPQWTPSRLNARYQPALRLAEVILAGHSFEQRVGDLVVTGFMFDMWRIYEDFVCVALREALAPLGGHSSLQYRTHLDEARAVKMRPDFVWSLAGVPLLVVDAKYKAEKHDGFPQSDLYQLLAYCTVLGLREGHLIYAKGQEEPRIHSVAGADVRVHCHTLDLALEPAALLRQLRQRVDLMVSGRSLQVGAPP